MKNGLSKTLAFVTALAAAQSAFALGDSSLSVRINKKYLASSKKIAIVAFTGSSLVKGNMGGGALLSAMLAKKNGGNSKMTLDNAYMSGMYDAFVQALTVAGYNFVPPEEVAGAKAYQEASVLPIPWTANAKGLKAVNAGNKKVIQGLAAATGADLFFFVTAGHQVGIRGSLGTIAGRQVGIASAMVEVCDAAGKKLGSMQSSTASRLSTTAIGAGFSDAAKIMPMLQDADQRAIDKLAKKIALKK